MHPQSYEWTCSICSITWVLQSTETAYTDLSSYDARYQTGLTMGYPNCVNETYGCMSADCVMQCFAQYGLVAEQTYCTFDEAYAICSSTTGVINPVGMYHFMAIRGVDEVGNIWVANSAPGYKGIYDGLSRSQFNSLGPTQLIYLV
jgi:hypothetical protein